MNGDSGAGVVAATPPAHPPHKERYFDRVDESSAEYQRERNMAPDLRQDFNMMEQRKRVSMILQSPAFCEELETLIHDQMRKGKNPTSLLALQQIADFMTTSVPTTYPAAPQGGMAALNMSLGMVTPVNDLRGSDSIAYEKGEKLLRCKLAAFYRLADLFGWSQLIYNHLTVRLNSDQERFLIVPFGLLYSEVTASSLVKINLQGEIVDRGSTNLGVNQAGFTLHSAIFSARPDIKCIVHIHTHAGAAVSAMKCGLLPISPEALSLGEVAYHDYHGILVDDEEKILIQKNLGPKSKVLILRNHGLVSVGETVEEAFYYIHNLVTACEIQVRTLASSGGPENLVMLDPGKYKMRPRHPEPAGDGTSPYPKWQLGEQEFEALMRMLDNLGYRTGYPYRCPALRDKAKKYSDVEIPPSATGYSYAEDSDSGARSPLKHSFQRGQRDKTRWLNTGRSDESPNEGLEGGGSPKAKTKVWTNITHDHVKPLLQSLSSGVCVPSCITNCLWTKEESIRQGAVANQFVPLNTNPKEVQEMRNKIREQNLQDIKTAGPQSQLLTGTVVDRSFVQRATIWHGELVTASKAIIEKEYQPRVIVTKTGPNPFNKFTDQELEEYRREVELKQKGEEGLEVQVDASDSSVVPGSGGVTSPPASSNDNLMEKQLLAASSSSTDAATEPEGSRRVIPSGPPVSPHKDFHCAVLKALSVTTDLSENDQPEQDVKVEDEPQVPEDLGKGPSPTRTPPSTPIRVEEERQQDQSPKDESDAATLRQTLPDLTPDEPSEAAVTALPAEDPAPSEPDSAPAHVDGEEPVAADDAAGDQGSDESPNKSPSKKKKKFRTPSFLKKNKKKSEP
ncbi:alpha-adducin isoform X2 [Silurus meridionalis]|uniref:alpha-adducin isoform X2 n=1 Tax=Silurus meridionalis TaxID=175797 RepID=UPI001EEA6CC7|nr:alpha-adducin isoform X2 [Silurus meridionalis]